MDRDHWKKQTCGDCIYFTPIPGVKKVILNDPRPVDECRHSPPVPFLFPQSDGKGGVVPSVMLTYPSLKPDFRACSYFHGKLDKM